MKRMMGGAVILTVVTALLPPQLDAQRGPGARRDDRGPRGAGIEAIMRMQERLELSDDQVQQLDALRQEAVQRQSEHQAQMAELRSQVMAGRLERSEFRAQMEARQEASEAVREQQRERVDAILSEAQRGQLEEWVAQGRAFRMGRASARRQGGRAGMRGARGFGNRRPGFRGQGRGFRGDVRGFRRGEAPVRGRRPFRRGGPDEEPGSA